MNAPTIGAAFRSNAPTIGALNRKNAAFPDPTIGHLLRIYQGAVVLIGHAGGCKGVARQR